MVIKLVFLKHFAEKNYQLVYTNPEQSSFTFRDHVVES